MELFTADTDKKVKQQENKTYEKKIAMLKSSYERSGNYWIQRRMIPFIRISESFQNNHSLWRKERVEK